MEAAEEARKEQVLLACARRDSSRAASEMQRRHLEAAVHLEGPSPGGAIHATFEAVKEEQVLRLSSETHQKEHHNHIHIPSALEIPRRPPSGTISNTAATNTFAGAAASTGSPAAEPLLRETCNAVASEVESRLERWKEQLYMQEKYSSNTPAPPVSEPSLAPSSAAADGNDNLKLLGGRGSGRSGDTSESWPGIFSFASK